MLPSEEKKEPTPSASRSSLLDEPDNDIAGSSCPSPIRGVIFDVGSTIIHSTEKHINLKMENAMKETLQSHFNWSTEQVQLFWTHFDQVHAEYDAKKLYVGTGTVRDEGWWPEPSIKSWIIEAHRRMNINTVDETASIYDEAIVAYRTPRVHNAKLIPNVVNTITELRDKYGIKCAICSNDRCISRLKAILQRNKLLHQDGQHSDHFDVIMISAELGKRKPDVRIVEPILAKWKAEYGITREQIVFVGDKLHADIQAARHLGLRSIHCKLYNREDAKYKKQKQWKANIDVFRQQHGTYLGAHSEAFLEAFTSFRADYIAADDDLTDYNEFIPKLRKLANTKGMIERSRFDVFKWRPIVIGVLLRPEKIEKFRKRRLFEVMEYRKDVVYKAIDVTLDLHKQGPFDVIVHKLNWYHFNAKFDEKINENLQNTLAYFKSLRSNIDLNLDENDQKQSIAKQNNNGPVCYITDNPLLGIRCQDRWYVYNTINHAEIVVDYEQKQNVRILCPKTILVTFEEIKQLKLKQSELRQHGNNHKLIQQIQTMSFPLYFKPRTSGRTPTGRYDGHCLYILASIDTIYDDTELFDNMLKNEDGDWILQEYIDHSCGCHKVYNLGYFVFASMNHSTPRSDDIKLQNTESKNKAIQVSSTGISSKQYTDQSKRDALCKSSRFYQVIARQLKEAFKVNLFGFDIVFDAQSNIGYVVDFNFMPSFKIAQNFHTVLTEYLLYEYFQFKRNCDAK